jgi:hypothetical protein
MAKNQSFEEYAKWLNDPTMQPKIHDEEKNIAMWLKKYRNVTQEDHEAVKNYLLGHIRMQGRTMTSSQQLSYAHHVDKIIHLENINEEMQELPFIEGNVRIPHAYKNQREHREWEPYYTAEAEANIYEYFKEDFETFGYPRMQQTPEG